MALLRRERDAAVRVTPWFVVGVGPRGEHVSVPTGGSLVVLGEPRVGKSTGILQVNGLPWYSGSALVRSTRPDNRRRLLRPNLAAGKPAFMLCLDGEQPPPGCEPYHVSLVATATTWNESRELALRLMRGAREPGMRTDGSDSAFEGYAAGLLAALLFAAQLGRRHGLRLTMHDVSDWLAEITLDPDSETSSIPTRLLVEGGGADGRHAAAAIANVGADRDNRMDTIQKLTDSLGHLLSGPVLDALAVADRAGGTDPRRVIDECGVLYIIVSDDHPVRSRAQAALAGLVEDELVAAARERWRAGQTHEPLRVLYDESATGAVNPNLSTWAATGGGDGIALLICAQSLAQLERVVPGEGAAIVNVATHRLFLRGHALDAERICAAFGQHSVGTVDMGRSSRPFGLPHRHVTVRQEQRAVVTPDVLTGIPNGYGLMVSARHLGRVRLVPAYQEPWASRFPA